MKCGVAHATEQVSCAVDTAKEGLENLVKCMVSEVTGSAQAGPCALRTDFAAGKFTLKCEFDFPKPSRRKLLGLHPYPIKHTHESKLLSVTEHGSFHFDHIYTSEKTIVNSDHGADAFDDGSWRNLRGRFDAEYNAIGHRALGNILDFDETPIQVCSAYTSSAGTCQGGLAVRFRAALDINPTADLRFDVTGPSAEFDLDLTGSGNIGVGVLVAAQCNAEHEFIQKVAHVVTCPFPGVCVTVLVFAKITIKVEGFLEAGANAVYQMDFSTGAKGTISFHDAKPTATFTANKPTLSTFWAVNAYGKVGARISVKVGPDVTLMATPGLNINISPWIAGEVTAYGAMKYEQASAGMNENDISHMLDWVQPSGDCPKDTKSKSSKYGRKAKSGRTKGKQGNANSKVETSGAEPPKDGGKGGFTFESSEMPTTATPCAAIGLSADAGADWEVGGFPSNIINKLGPFKLILETEICEALTAVLMKAMGGMPLKVAGAAAKCFGKALGVDIPNPEQLANQAANAVGGPVCRSIINELWEALEAAPDLSVQGTLPCNSDDDGCEKGVDDFCTDLWKAYVGDPSCADKVGCGGDYSDVNSEVIGLAPSTTGSSYWNVKSRSHEETCHIEGNCIRDSIEGDYASSQVCEFEYVGNAEITRKSWGLEPHASCSYDWLTMGSAKYCGTATSNTAFPSSTTVSGTTNFKFQTDGSVQSSGFELCATPTSYWNVKSRSTGACHIDGNCIRDSIEGDYASSQVCEFEYVGNAEITRKSWGLEPHASCSYDWLTMGGAKYCGTATSNTAFPSSTTVSGTTNFKFQTDGSVQSSGFELCATPSSSLLMKYSDSVQQTLTSSAIPQALLITVGVAAFSMAIVATVGIRRWKLRQETDVTPLPADISNL
jgi:hypothetical protein